MIWNRLFRWNRAIEEEANTSDEVRRASLPEVTDATIHKRIDRRTPVLVFFAADGNVPCRMLEPVLYDLSEQYVERIEILKLDIEESPAAAAEFDILSLPTVIVFSEGKERQRIIGAKSKKALTEELAAHLAG